MTEIESKAEERVPVEIVATNISVPILSTNDLPGPNDGISWSSKLEELVPAIESAGYTGIKLFPTKPIIEDVRQRRRAGEAELELLAQWIASLHQTPHKGEGYKERIISHWLPPRDVSIDQMKEIEEVLPQPVPGIYFVGPSLTDSNTGAIVRSTQPKAEDYQRFGVSNARQFHGVVEGFGFNAMTLDSAHSRSTGQGPHKADAPLPWEEDWAQHLGAGKVNDVDISLFRTDMTWDADVAALTIAEGRAFQSGDWQRAARTEVAAMIALVLESWRPHRWAAHEVLQFAVETAPSKVGSKRDFLNRHKAIVDTLGQVVEQAGGRIVKDRAQMI